jgi:hypothetical protein
MMPEMDTSVLRKGFIVDKLQMWPASRLMRGACMTCMGTCGNGVLINGTVIMITLRLKVVPGLIKIYPQVMMSKAGCSEVVLGIAILVIVVRLIASTTLRTAATATGVSASVASPRTNSLPFNPLVLYSRLFGLGLVGCWLLPHGAAGASPRWPQPRRHSSPPPTPTTHSAPPRCSAGSTTLQ